MLLSAGRPSTSDSEPKPQGRGTEAGARVIGHELPETSVEGGTCEPALFSGVLARVAVECNVGEGEAPRSSELLTQR